MQTSSTFIFTGFFFGLFSSGAFAQQAPRPQIVREDVAGEDAGVAFYARGKNLYGEAQRSVDLETRRRFYVRAGDLFQTYLMEFPDHSNAPAATYYAGSSYYQAGEIEKASWFFRLLLEKHEKGRYTSAAAYTLAVDAFNNERYDEAAPLFAKYAEHALTNKNKAKGYMLAGRSYRASGRGEEAAQVYGKIINDPTVGLYHHQARLAIGYIEYDRHRFEEAFQLFSKIADSAAATKYRGEAALNAAITAKKIGKPEVSEGYLRMLLKQPGMEAFRPSAQIALMEAYDAEKNYKEVLAVFKQSALPATGEKEGRRIILGAKALLKLNQPNAARKLFRKVERLVNPQSDLAFQAAYYRLNCFFQIEGSHVPDQVDAFLSIYASTRADDTRIHTAMLMKAESLFSEEKIKAAAQTYSGINATKISATNLPGFYYKSGWALAESGDLQAAIRHLSHFIETYPEDSRAHAALAKRAKVYTATGESNKAIKDFDQIIESKNAPVEVVSLARLESARTRRKEDDIPRMLSRYQDVLEHVKDIGPGIEAEANYWIGLGLIKSNRSEEASDFLKKARDIREDVYGKNAGVLLAISYFAAQNPENLIREIKLALTGEYSDEIPDQAMQWAGMQAYNHEDYSTAAELLALSSDTEEPRTTPKEIWRYIAKSLIRIDKPNEALSALKNLLDVESEPAWIADGQLDQARAYLALGQLDKSRKAADAALELRPSGRTSAGLRIISGDLDMEASELGKAAAHYLYVIQFHEDDRLKPLALHKYIGILETQGKSEEVETFKSQLSKEFPNWKAPEKKAPGTQ